MDGGGNGIPGGALPTSMGAGGMLGLDMSLHPHSQLHQHSGHSQLHQQLPQAHHMLPFQAPAAADGDHPVRHAAYMPPFVAATRGKQHSTMSPEEEPGYGEEVDDQARRGGTSQAAPAASPWQRMKWNDNMVRLLIQVVYRVGDDGGGPEVEQQQAHGSAAKGKKSAAAAAASALLQKKGKWKSVSRAMMEKGYSVSPQQCEDKFNDLNKRYKRVNDLLGKGTACLVVENQALLETMDISAKAKEEARKLLNSKHLFFREMCAYHHAGGGSTCTAPPSHQPPPPPPPDQQQQQLCFHHPSTGRPAIGGRTLAEEEGMTEAVDDDDDDVDSEDDEDFEDEEDEDDDDKEDPHHKRHGHGRQHHHMHEDGEEEDSKEFAAGSKKHGKRTLSQMSASPPLSLTLSSPSSSVQQLRSEMMAIAGGGEQQQRQWLRRKAADLEEQRLGFQCRAFQLERQRFKWLRFSSNKEREMERMKLDNERHRLENDRMLLLLRQKELELVQHGGSGGGGVSSTTVQHHVPNADRPSTTT